MFIGDTFDVVAGSAPRSQFVASLIGGVPSSEARVLCASDDSLVAVKAPLRALCGSDCYRSTNVSKATSLMLRRVLHVHRISVGRDIKKREELEALIDLHVCDGSCDFIVYVLKYHAVLGEELLSKPLTMCGEVVVGNSTNGCFPASLLKVVTLVEAKGMCGSDASLLGVRAPLRFLCGSDSVRSRSVDKSNVSLLRVVLHAHNVLAGRDITKRADLESLIDMHICTPLCHDLIHILAMRPHVPDVNIDILPAPPNATKKPDPVAVKSPLLPLMVTDSAAGGAGEPTHAIPMRTPNFPPSPCTEENEAHIIRDWCKFMSEDVVRESPCAVCASITENKLLHNYSRDELPFEILARPGEGVTRLERRSASEPIREIEGPILYEGGMSQIDGKLSYSVCRTCSISMKKNKIPRLSLANGRWVGAAPPIFSQLSYVEQLLIGRNRHSFCVGQVALGQRYMTSNVIVFGQPVLEAYKVLPPPRAEICDILAVLFTGTARPTDNDLKRSPFLVRLPVVVECLQFLILNSSAYEDVEFSAENLSQYEDGKIPVGYIYRKSVPNVGGESQAVYESVPDRSTESGPCPFIVHTLGGQDLANMTYEQKCAHGLKWFDEGNKVLAYGHESTPQSTMQNPYLFPRMMPWLYPYGLGGFDNSKILPDRKPAFIRHIRANLSYGDRRFQMDRCFPFIVFNQRQIRESSTGGYLLTNRANFDAVAEKLVNIDRSTLDDIINRSARGEYVKPVTEAEKNCFDLISAVDFVSGRVDGPSRVKSTSVMRSKH